MHKWESQMIQFATEFQKLKLSDEKNDFLNTFLNFLYGRLEDDPTWQGMNNFFNAYENIRTFSAHILSHLHGCDPVR